VAEFPLTVGVVASVAAPVLAAIGALVALLTDCTIDLERRRPAAAARKGKKAAKKAKKAGKAKARRKAKTSGAS
jgi:hypothetical protein